MGITTAGKVKVANLIGLNTTASGVTFGYPAIGSGAGASTAFAVGQTDLQGAVKVRQLWSTNSGTQAVTATDTLTTVTTFTFGTTATVEEVGFFSAATVGTMLCRTVITGIVCTAPNDTLQVTITVQMT